MKYFLFALLILVRIVKCESVDFNIVYEWKYVNYTWDSQEQMQAAIDSGNYVATRCLLYDATKADDGRLFVTTPKEFGLGAPATLMTVSDIKGPGGLLLRPYPDWSWHNNNNNCSNNSFINIQHVDIKCEHLFVLDSGKVGSDQVCNPKLVIFRLEDNIPIKTIYIPIDIATDETGAGLLVTPLIHIPETCEQFLEEMIIFIADMQGNGLIVYESSRKRMCRVESDYMKPTYTFISIANDNFTYENGIFSMAVIYDDLYYAPISGREIYKIPIKTLLKCPSRKCANKKSKLVITLSSPSGQIASVGHTVLYSDSRAISLLGTNVYKSHTVVLAQDFQRLQAIPSLKVSNFWKKVTFMSDRFQRFLTDKVNLSEINFRYGEMELSEVLESTDVTPTINHWLNWFATHFNKYKYKHL